MRRAFGDFSSSSLFDSGFKEEDQITLVRIGPIARSHGEKLVRSLFMKVLDLAASVLNQKITNLLANFSNDHRSNTALR